MKFNKCLFSSQFFHLELNFVIINSIVAFYAKYAMISSNYLTRLKSKVFSLERLKKYFGSEEILGLEKVD